MSRLPNKDFLNSQSCELESACCIIPFLFSSSSRWTRWLQTFCWGRVGSGSLTWRPWDWALWASGVSTWRFRLRAPAWPCFLSGCSSRSVLLWSAPCHPSLRLFPVPLCKRRRANVWRTQPSLGLDLDHRSSSAARTVSGWDSRRPPAPACLDTRPPRVRPAAQVISNRPHKQMYVYKLHPHMLHSLQTKHENNGKMRVEVHWGLKLSRGNERPRKLMKQGSNCDTVGYKGRSALAALNSERKSGVKGSLLQRLML